MFTYQMGSNPAIDYPRLLIADTDAAHPIFDDSEITAATRLQACQFQSGMLYTGAAGANLPASPVSYLRVAALLLDAIASSKARLSGIAGLLDVRPQMDKAAAALRAQAAEYRQVDDDAGAFVLIEMCNNQWSFAERFWKQVQRQSGF